MSIDREKWNLRGRERQKRVASWKPVCTREIVLAFCSCCDKLL